jgi:hypothetical protein
VPLVPAALFIEQSQSTTSSRLGFAGGDGCADWATRLAQPRQAVPGFVYGQYICDLVESTTI